MIKPVFKYALVAVVSAAIGLGLSSTQLGNNAAQSIKAGTRSVTSTALEAVVSRSDSLGTRELLLLENPSLLKSIMKGGAFGGDFSRAAAKDMFGRYNQEAIDEVDQLARIELIAPRTWMIYLPIVNAVLFETDEGLVLVDAGMAPAGPAIARLIESVSDKALHTIIYTHGHVDHAYGTWALMDDKPQIIAQQNLPKRFDRYLKLRGSLAKFMSQPLASLPKENEDLVYPTTTFNQSLELNIGGERFVLKHHRGETDDQLYVWVPGRKALASADYYQGFLPNAGNGKRQQRFIEDWAGAMYEMADLNAEFLLPAHGKAISDAAEIKENLTALGDTLTYIVDHVINELNKGTRIGLIPPSLTLPERLAKHPSLNEQYVSPADIAKMVMRQYTGWWDEIPSHWTPETFEAQAAEIITLAGGVDTLIDRARTLAPSQLGLASHLTDWAWFAQPDNPAVQQLVIDIYSQRINHQKSNTMEMLAYLDLMVAARHRQLNQTKRPQHKQ